jgi:uncharacterized phage protein (TIGR02220 family)
LPPGLTAPSASVLGLLDRGVIEMANWFKLYETDLDETRMRYAMSKLPEVWPVWTGILMECCKHRGDTIKWGKESHELFGFSDRLKISIPIVNQAISLLSEIHYIEKRGDCLRVLKWGEKQDDYLLRKSQGYWQKRREIKNVTVNHSESHIEERRGEEIKGEEKRGDKSKIETATYARVLLHLLNQATGRNFRECDSSLTPIIQRLSEPDVDVEGCKIMINRQVAMWKGTSMEEFLRPETLFGKTKFNGYYAGKDQPINRPNQNNGNGHHSKPDHAQGF